ncbi:hypothetical protein FGW20_08180 [Methanoculleus sp. FWC-SCC3]|uniref:Type I restriction modification DNA specificity domain-containing protein n=1 Tax=Methanoculleus methanifontis TaxID=2584086 RepID=A0ABT8M3I5_9EURY|nr:restriction endonuclease subunit S [Methanoculleus sp. FWC-SCC3]MDN7013016.1 hypothetical protein [Methanoculleus sp. FWC-SCC3]
MIGARPAPGDLRPNPDWTGLPIFDRRGWKRVRFGDIVANLNETERDPAGAGIERFIGLEHLEPGSLHIHTWGNVADGTTFTRRCRPGQVLFGKRRAYQRKVAVAEFDAVVSGDIYVLAPKDEQLIPELLPFVCLSERFFQYAVETSAGSLSPRTSWKHLAEFEFGLPPLDQQRRIAEVLWAVDETHQLTIRLQNDLFTAKNAYFDEELKIDTTDKPDNLKNLGSALAGIVAGKSPRSSSNPVSNDGFGVLKVSAVGDGVYREDENKSLLDRADFIPSLEVKQGMILVTRCNANLSGIGRACLVEKTRTGLMLCDKTLQLVPDETIIDKEFLLQGLHSKPYRQFIERSANGTDAKNISQATLCSAPFWIPSTTKQQEVKKRIKQFTIAIDTIQQRVAHLSAFQSTIINEI